MLPISQITDEKVALEIGLPDELLDFARMVNSGELSGRADVKVRLTADIDLTGHQWTPIGLGKAQFGGRFDGCGHTISAVTIQKKWPGNYGLFGYVTGAIQNVTVTGTIYNRSGEPHSAVGGIVGDLAGGVAGAVMDSRVERCTYTGAITVLGGEIYYIDVGGIAGNVQGRSSVTDCLDLGVLDATAYDFNCACIGGVIGRVEGPAVVRDCCNRGSVSGGERAVGGILGDFSLYDRVAEADCVLENCLNLGEVVQSPDSCSASCGGIVGEIINKAVDRPVQVRNCVSLGELNCLGKDGPAHPITAYAEGAVFENNYYDESLPAQGREDLRAAVAAGCAAKPAAYLTSNEFLEDMERCGGRYALGTDGMLTVRELENGGNAYDDE